jgi:hypothetical protein
MMRLGNWDCGLGIWAMAGYFLKDLQEITRHRPNPQSAIPQSLLVLF